MSAKRRETERSGVDAQLEIGFGQAIRELEQILAGIEGEEVDLDRLAQELGRAAELLEICRAKIRRTEVEVTEIVQRLETPES
jgi:exodeoxyribonuclease VII small subunit